MKKVKMFLLLTAMVALVVQAQTATPKINQKQKEQQVRIKQGVKTGELTTKETRKLEKQQLKIRHDKKIAKSDGVVTKQERRQLLNEQQRAGKNILRKKHNSRVNNSR
ncbi:MAG: hypothetical protein NTX65_10080 [Ignavibacteriales bacterium]|nr:hypothetical protein [Ignavibacteriales bacterium]